jgi:hypothetical protein
MLPADLIEAGGESRKEKKMKKKIEGIWKSVKGRQGGKVKEIRRHQKSHFGNFYPNLDVMENPSGPKAPEGFFIPHVP